MSSSKTKASKLPSSIADNETNQVANRLHSLAIHLLRGARKHDIETGLSPERLSILSILVYVGPKTVNQLAELEQVSAPAITRTVKGLEKQGLIFKARARDDQRVVYVSATTKSRELMEQARAKRIEQIANQIEGLDSEQLSKVIQAIELIK